MVRSNPFGGLTGLQFGCLALLKSGRCLKQGNSIRWFARQHAAAFNRSGICKHGRLILKALVAARGLVVWQGRVYA
jgi:hypothetical protein